MKLSVERRTGVKTNTMRWTWLWRGLRRGKHGYNQINMSVRRRTCVKTDTRWMWRGDYVSTGIQSDDMETGAQIQSADSGDVLNLLLQARWRWWYLPLLESVARVVSEYVYQGLHCSPRTHLSTSTLLPAQLISAHVENSPIALLAPNLISVQVVNQHFGK